MRGSGELLSDLVRRRLDRRRMLKTLGVAAAASLLGGPGAPTTARRPSNSGTSRPGTLGFRELKRGRDGRLHVPEGYEAQVLLRWGDPVVAGAPPFDPERATAATQRLQFGFNCDYVGFLSLPGGSRASDRGLLGVNHEYTSLQDMLPGFPTRAEAASGTRAEHVDLQLAAMGFSVVEIRRVQGRWRPVTGSRYGRRITGFDTEIALGGPAAGHPRLRTSADPEARRIVGTFGNCAGGVTPWGTFLTCEENFQDWFGGAPCEDRAELANHERYGVGPGPHPFARHRSRFDLSREPREPNRFGWVVEIDPHDPESVPIKRTALGRFRHEGATCVLDPVGRVVVYSGDDAKGEYLYRFVTEGRFDPDDREANRRLLDSGVLSVARFHEDGRLEWLPLVHGEGGLDRSNGFRDQGDVVIEARRAADLLGATPMDRPEDVEANPADGVVYVMLTNNDQRGLMQPVDAANPRARNVHGHVIEIRPPVVRGERVHAAAEARWDVFIRAGDPENPDHAADYQGSAVSEDGWLSCPDNAAFDGRGRLWIATDGARHTADGLYACDTVGPGRALTRLFLRSPVGAEVCGPFFTPDDTTLFCSIQHPGAGPRAHFGAPLTRWPDFDPALPARPSVVAVVRLDGGRIGDPERETS